MIRFHPGYAMVAVMLLVPATASAQRGSILGKLPATPAASALPADVCIARLAGPDWILRLSDDVRRDQPHKRFNVVHKNGQRDPVGNGVRIGALTGALTGVGLTAIMTTQCDGKCTDPSLSTALLVTTAVGAGVGALVGFLVDRAR